MGNERFNININQNKSKKMKYIYYNRLKSILESEKNNLLHLEALEVMVSMFIEMFGESTLSTKLKIRYNNLVIKLNK
jgi:hypothetical protein